jgi:hypothetical protein
VRGFLAGLVKKKLKLNLVSDKIGDERIYRIAKPGRSMTSAPQQLRATADPAVEDELELLPTTPIADLRKRYHELFRIEPPKAFGPDLLRRSIAHRIHQRVYGGPSPYLTSGCWAS